MQNYAEPGFEIKLQNNTLIFVGQLEKMEYAEVDAFLRGVDQMFSAQNCVIDLVNLKFLNSSGIRALATFLLGSPKNFEIRVNNSITWQKESIPALACLKPEGIKIVA